MTAKTDIGITASITALATLAFATISSISVICIAYMATMSDTNISQSFISRR